MKKAKIAVMGFSAATSLMAMLPVQQAMAASVACTAPSATQGAVCAVTSGAGTYVVSAFSFTGSNEVSIAYEDAGTSGFGVCAGHARGNNAYGMTTNGGGMTIKSGVHSGSAVASSGCS